MKIDINKNIERLARGIAHSMGLELVEAIYSPRKGRAVVRVYIHKPDGVAIDDCSNFSRELEVLLDAENLVEGSYDLEVSSPGLDRPLKTKGDFLRNVGKSIVMSYKTELSPNLSVCGRLQKVSEDGVTVDTGKGEKFVPINDILIAKLEISI